MHLSMKIMSVAALASTVVIASAATAAPHNDPPASGPARSHPRDSAAVAGVVNAFHKALSDGDSTRALGFLSADVVILESGSVETRAEYRSHHLGSDIEFARAIPSVRSPMTVRVNGNTAWVTSTSTTDGTFRDRPVKSSGAELMVLTKTRGEWKIRAIHWSSRRRT